MLEDPYGFQNGRLNPALKARDAMAGGGVLASPGYTVESEGQGVISDLPNLLAGIFTP